MLKFLYAIFQIEYTEAILSNSSRKLLWFEITEVLIAVKKSKFIVSFLIIFGTLSLRISQIRVVDDSARILFVMRPLIVTQNITRSRLLKSVPAM